MIMIALLAAGVALAKNHKHKKRSRSRPGIESITMQRTGCFGKCPVYVIELDKDGQATYTAYRNTADTGILKKNFGTSRAASIFSKTMSDRTDTCKNTYKAMATDLPGLIFTIRYADSVKKINNANFGPPVLRQLADSLDALIGKRTDDSWHR